VTFLLRVMGEGREAYGVFVAGSVAETFGYLRAGFGGQSPAKE
jgi:hypothetical protein